MFLFLVYPYSDYDWGWHYRYGEYLWTHGRILRHDIFSWTLPGYPYANHSWLFDPVLYLLFNRVSFLGLSLAGGGLGLIAFVIGTRRGQLSFWQLGLLAMCFVILTREALFQGLRAQVPSLVMFALFMDLLWRAREGRRWCCWALPGLFLLWANLHGSFPLGLVIFAGFVVSDLVLTRFGVGVPGSRPFLMTGGFVLAAALTLVNPFTYHVYQEAIVHLNHPLLRTVMEWNRPEFSPTFGAVFVGYSALLAWGFVTRRRLSDLPLIAAAALTLALALSGKRHVPIYMVITLPFAAMTLKNLPLRLEGIKRTVVVLAILLAGCGWALYWKLPQHRLILANSISTYCWYGSECSEGLGTYLVRNPPNGRGFNYYDWGGYFIGLGVPTKLFIDGRMHLWDRDGYQPMAEYYAIYDRKDWARFERYDFDWVVVPRNAALAKYLMAPPAGPAANGARWTAAYADQRALFFVRQR